MKKNLILKTFGIIYFIVGLSLHINMVIEKSWPTYFFILICILGILLLIISFFAKKLSLIMELAISLLSIFPFLYLLFF